MNKTGIEYLTHTWNPIAMRCTPVSDGCDHCWHIRMAKRHAGNKRLAPDVRAAKAGGMPILLADELEAPLRRRKSARIGVQFMGDLFHKDVSAGFIDKVFAVMALCPQHTFQVLTKRPERMAEYMGSRARSIEHWEAAARSVGYTLRFEGIGLCPFPLPNVQLGTSVENQDEVHRIGHLMRCPAPVRFLSLEPLLGDLPGDLPGILSIDRCPSRCDGNRCTMRAGHQGRHRALRPTGGWGATDEPTPSPINWVIVGCESGPGARPMETEWVRSVVQQCREAGVPVFVKQLNALRCRCGLVHVAGRPVGAVGWEGACRSCRFHESRMKPCVSKDPAEWPEDLCHREWPKGA
jgi:protein gp37